MAKLPGEEAFGSPRVPAGGGGVVPFRPNTGMEGVPAQEMARSGAEVAGASRIVIALKDEQDTLRAEEAFNALRQQQIDLTYGESGFANLKGANAVNRPVLKEYGTQFDKAAQSLSATLENPHQRALFKRRSEVAGLEYRQGIVHHISQQTDVYAKSVYDTTVATEINAAVANPATTPLALTRMNEAAKRAADRFGYDDKWVEMQASNNKSMLFASQIRTQITHDPIVAQQYYEAHKNELNADVRPVLEHQVKQAVLPVEAKAIADASMAALAASNWKGDTRAALGDLLQAGDRLANEAHPNDPIFRDLVQAQIKGKISTIVAEQDGRSKQAYGVLLASAIGPKGSPKPTTLDQLLSSPQAREAWSITEPQGQRALIALLDQNGKEAMGTPPKENGQVTAWLNERIRLPADNPLRITSWTEFIPYLGKGVTRESLDWLKKNWEEYQTPDGRRLTDVREGFLKSVKGQFDSSTQFKIDAKGGEDFDKFRQHVMRIEAEMRQAGAGKVYELYNKDSPAYAGKMIPAFQRSITQKIQELSDELRRDVAPSKATSKASGLIRAPGEAPVQAAKDSGYNPGETYAFKQGRFTYIGPINPTSADKANPSNWVPAGGN